MAKPLAECQAVKELLEKKRSQCGIMLAEIETNTRAEFKKIRGTIRRMARYASKTARIRMVILHPRTADSLLAHPKHACDHANLRAYLHLSSSEWKMSQRQTTKQLKLNS